MLAAKEKETIESLKAKKRDEKRGSIPKPQHSEESKHKVEKKKPKYYLGSSIAGERKFNAL